MTGTRTEDVPSVQPGRDGPSGSPPSLGVRLQIVLGNRFEVLDPFAVGGMATLFQVRHRVHGGLLAAKVLHEALTTRPEVMASFRREAAHAARLGGHPNAIPVFDAGEREELLYLLMPFVEGQDLDQLLQRNGPLSRGDALHFAAQLSSLLCHAESHGITHGDLAPGNIRLDTFGRYRLMDFGISHAADEPIYKPLGGTPLYTSPEQLRGEIPDIRADLYALGAVLCEVMTGKPLFQAETLDELRRKHLAGNWQLPEPIASDEVLARTVRKLLATDRDQRLSSAFELSETLAALGFERPEFRPRPVTSGPGMRRSRLS